MIDRKELLADLQTLLRKEIEPDLRKRSELPEIAAALKAEFDKAKKAKRTAMNYTDWRADKRLTDHFGVSVIFEFR